MNYLWLDCETTGLSEHRHDIIQLACIPVINGIEQKSFNEFCQPTNWNTIEDAAIAVHGITRDMMQTFQTQEALLEKFNPLVLNSLSQVTMWDLIRSLYLLHFQNIRNQVNSLECLH